MATLKELWTQAGCKPVRVRSPSVMGPNRWFYIHGIAPDGCAFGYHHDGHGNAFLSVADDWEPYPEPKKTKVLCRFLDFSILVLRYRRALYWRSCRRATTSWGIKMNSTPPHKPKPGELE